MGRTVLYKELLWATDMLPSQPTVGSPLFQVAGPQEGCDSCFSVSQDLSSSTTVDTCASKLEAKGSPQSKSGLLETRPKDTEDLEPQAPRSRKGIYGLERWLSS